MSVSLSTKFIKNQKSNFLRTKCFSCSGWMVAQLNLFGGVDRVCVKCGSVQYANGAKFFQKRRAR